MSENEQLMRVVWKCSKCQTPCELSILTKNTEELGTPYSCPFWTEMDQVHSRWGERTEEKVSP